MLLESWRAHWIIAWDQENPHTDYEGGNVGRRASAHKQNASNNTKPMFKPVFSIPLQYDAVRV